MTQLYRIRYTAPDGRTHTGPANPKAFTDALADNLNRAHNAYGWHYRSEPAPADAPRGRVEEEE